jgi:hypothetical protein
MIDSLERNARRYSDYCRLVTVLKFHLFVTSFFCLWALAVDVLARELIASKFLHVVFPLLGLHWWFLAYYPAVSRAEDLERRLEEKGDGDARKDLNFRPAESRRTRITKAKRNVALLFAVLALIDVLMLALKVIPIGVECVGNWDTGAKIPIECGGWNRATHSFGTSSVTEGESRGTGSGSGNGNLTLYALTVAAALAHVVAGVLVIFVAAFRANVDSELYT